MKIKSIQLSNFRCYKGIQPPIVFSTDPEKNVTVFVGENNAGKTTFIQAFLWCLYDKTSFKTKSIINAEAELDLMPNKYCDAFVEIVLLHEDKEFVIRRSQRFYLNSNETVKHDDSVLKISYKEVNGTGNQEPIPAKECDYTVKKILPEALTDYFFFNGEAVTDINNRGDVVAAVRGLMGLDVIGQARDRLNPKYSGTVTSELNEALVLKADAESDDLKNKLKKSEMNTKIRKLIEVEADKDEN
jgi:DNA sulfur modification protein DndD